MKYLVWVVLGYFAVSWFMRSKRNSKRMADSPPDKKDAEPILQCAHCGVHIPASEAIITQTGAIFCCEEHQRQIKKSEF